MHTMQTAHAFAFNVRFLAGMVTTLSHRSGWQNPYRRA